MWRFFVVLGVLGACATPGPTLSRPSGRSTLIAFGSCADQNKPQPVWRAILALEPAAFLFIGDNVYADTEDPKVMKAAYEKLGRVRGFAELRKRVPVLPIWDDHDYGANDAGSEYPMRERSQALFLDFFEVPKADPRRKRDGIYHAKMLGEPGQRVQLILLDTRFFRGPLEPRSGGEHPFLGRWQKSTNKAQRMLGEAQWKWLEAELKKPAELRLIASGVQVVAEDHGWETWANLPAERARLFALLKNVPGVLLLSGDRHKGELSVMDAGLGYPLYDLTSSGLNKGHRRWYYFEKNRHRVATMRWGDNFGVVKVDWTQKDPKVSLQIRYADGEIAIQHRIRLSTLTPGALPPEP